MHRERKCHILKQACWKSIDIVGSLPLNDTLGLPRQFDGFSSACHSPATAPMTTLDASPASPKVFLGSTALPQTPPSQLSRAASSPPPVRRSRNIASPPHASHPILSSAITVACTAAPDACHSTGRLPTKRQLGFSFDGTPAAQHPSPFTAVATTPESPSLLHKLNSLPGMHHRLNTALSEHQDSLCLQDSGMLTHMLHHATLLHTKSKGYAAGSSSNGSFCSLSESQMLRANRCWHPAPPQSTPAPPESRFHEHGAESSTLLGGSRSAFSKSALKHRAEATRHQGEPYEVPAPTPPGGARTLQRAATLPPMPDVPLFSNACVRLDSVQTASARSGNPSAMALAQKGHLLSHRAAARNSLANPFCSRSDSSAFRLQGGRVDATDQAIGAAQYSPMGHLSWDLPGSSDRMSQIQSQSVCRPGHLLHAPMRGAPPGALPSSPSSRTYPAGSQMLTLSVDTRTTHMHAFSPEGLRPPSNGPAPLSRATDWDSASWHEARDPNPRATNNNLTGRHLESPTLPNTPQHSLSGHRAAASGPESEVGLECPLMVPPGTRSHKRPRLEDKLKEGTAVQAFLASRRSKLESGYDGG
ncbi:hypothetical protein ABBQ38_009693 [Trebouxia sp. C0009 RCD-2024]